MTTLDLDTVQALFRKRVPDSHKGDHGHVLLIAGSKNKMGAAIITAKACLRAGAGLVTVNIPEKERQVIYTSAPETMIEFRKNHIDWEKYDAFAIGPGIGTETKAEKLLKNVVESCLKPVVFDADALNILAKNQTLLLKLPKSAVLTPHPKEFDRLFGNHLSEEERRNTATEKAGELGCIIVLKGHRTFITDGNQGFENITGNSGLAKGGSGDALTGIITAFLAQGYEPLNAALLGVYIHGLAADITLETQSGESMLITDVIENLGSAFKKIQK